MSPTEIERLTSALFIDRMFGGRQASKFWTLLVLAAIIATAGVVSDSTATVIGAMIVAPLMTPILGSALALVLADRTRLWRSVALVVGGALVVIAIGVLMGQLTPSADDFASNTQVRGRISPRLIDLLAALATGTVGAFAVVRSDISDTLPGVAIAISLVPPLAVVGLLLSAGQYSDAAGAALLFATNVAAIVATGTVVFLAYRVRAAAEQAGVTVARLRGTSLVAVGAFIVVLAVPLALGSLRVAANQILVQQTQPLAEEWALARLWEVTDVTGEEGTTVVVTTVGQLPAPVPEDLRRSLDESGLGDTELRIVGVVGSDTVCPAGLSVCTAIAGE